MLHLALLVTAALAGEPVAPAGPAAAPPPATLPAALTCSGGEPFWSIVLRDGTANAATPDRPTAPTVDVSVVPTPQADAFLVSPKGKGPGFRWLVVEKRACTDPMSGRASEWAAVSLTASAGFVSGCCRVPD